MQLILAIILIILSICSTILTIIYVCIGTHIHTDTLATLSIGLLAGSIAFYWSNIQHLLNITKAKGSLRITIRPDSVVECINESQLSIHISSVKSKHKIIRFDRWKKKHKRMSHLDVLKKLNKLSLDEHPWRSKLASESTLAPNDKILLALENMSIGAIEKEWIIILFIEVAYSIAEQNNMIITKRIGCYWHTSPDQYLDYMLKTDYCTNMQAAISQLEKDMGIPYIKNPDIFKSMFLDLVPNGSLRDEKLSELYDKYSERCDFQVDQLPHNNWYIFRIDYP